MGVYDGTNFFRVETSFVAQLSDARYKQPTPSPEQLAAIHPLPAEFDDLRHRRGTLSMARHDGRPDSGETSFSILLGDAPHLDGQYTVFGHLETGEDVLASLSLRRAGFYEEGFGGPSCYLLWGGLSALVCGLLLFVLSRRLGPVALGSVGLLLVMLALRV